ncbi:TonB-dependent receptor [uncultured Massilia sp.]|uniref:TonB-dependent receptor n=1 Tax=uncultured Massilia sp. TaxID=169973 RepID=UPI0025876296|nr:TonB-dependent receptor [uncultured Massilia sp.]
MKILGAKGDQLRLALTRTYRAPPLSNLVPTLFHQTFNTEVSPDFVGNPALRPELATGVDAAWEHYFATGGLVWVGASSRAIRDFIRSTVTCWRRTASAPRATPTHVDCARAKPSARAIGAGACNTSRGSRLVENVYTWGLLKRDETPDAHPAGRRRHLAG